MSSQSGEAAFDAVNNSKQSWKLVESLRKTFLFTRW